jgi:type III pantothenate kinase
MTEEQNVPNVLAFDCGNGGIKMATVCGEVVGDIRRFAAGEMGSLRDAIERLWPTLEEPKRIVAASVAPEMLKALEANVLELLDLDILVVGREIPLPMATDLREPADAGVDRVLAATAAYDRLGAACVVIDCGTAITVDVVSEEGVFLGGSILPGLSLSLRALSQEAANLPEVTLEEPTEVIGKDTTQSLLTGVVCGLRGAVRERIESFATEVGHWPVAIATGGDAKLLLTPALDEGVVQAIVEDLVLRGVAMSYYNSLVIE